MKVIKPDRESIEKFINRIRSAKRRVSRIVTKIIEDVRLRGDNALVEYTKKFDKVKLKPKEFRVTEAEINSAFNELDSSLIYALKKAIDNVFDFYKRERPRSFRIKRDDGRIIEEVFLPIERVGIYIPAGQSPLVSSVYMCAIPAIVAGVKEIVLVSPPNSQGFINPYILAVASLLRIKEIYKIGGAQAIAALAYGTNIIKKVDKIIGPGNEYVTEAKRQVFGVVGIDMLAGNSEVMIVAGKDSNLSYIIRDLEAQTEHRGGIGVVVVLSKDLFKQILRYNLPNTYIILADNLSNAAEIVNIVCPEHLEIMLKQPRKFIKKIRHSGAIFIGDYSPVALGDYIAGPSHVLPTGGTARFFSGLSVSDFLRKVHIVNFSKKALIKEKESLERIASIEGMKKHIESIDIRVSSYEEKKS